MNCRQILKKVTNYTTFLNRIEKHKTNQDNSEKSKPGIKEEKSLEDKLTESEDKLLRSLAEIENQRRRFEKEIQKILVYL